MHSSTAGTSSLRGTGFVTPVSHVAVADATTVPLLIPKIGAKK
jgi:hypothetical protein